MSIVSNALKKTQEQRSKELLTNKPVTPEKAVKLISTGDTPSKARSFFRISLILILFTLCGIFVYLNIAPISSYIKNIDLPFSLTEKTVITTTGSEDTADSISAEEITQKKVKIQPSLIAETDTPIIEKPDSIIKIYDENTVSLPVLNGIMYTPTSPQAVMNNKIVRKGDLISGFNVLEIFEEKVVLEFKGKKYDIELE